MADAPIHFVVFDWTRWRTVARRGLHSAAEHAPTIITNEDVWIVQTWLLLSARGLRATIGPVPVVNAINLVDGINLTPSAFDPAIFFVGCRGDGHYPAICQVVLHQNTLGLVDQPALYIPQWPQPALIPRNPARRGIRRLGFFGHASINLDAEYRSARFSRELRRRNCQLEIRGRSAECVAWNDYSSIDLVLAARSIPLAHRMLKPVNKLTNAWLARVPVLIGAEPAVEAIRESPLDYIGVQGTADALAGLDRLSADPGLYERMVEHGCRRGSAFSEEAIAARWFTLLDILQARFESWRQLAPWARADDYAARMASHQEHFARHAQFIHGGYASLGFGAKWWETRDPGVGVVHG